MKYTYRLILTCCGLAVALAVSIWSPVAAVDNYEALHDLVTRMDIIENNEPWLHDMVKASEYDQWSITGDLVNDFGVCVCDMSEVEGDIEFRSNLGLIVIKTDINCTGSVFIHHGTDIAVAGDLTVGRSIYSNGAIEVAGDLYAGEAGDYSVGQHIIMYGHDLYCHGDISCAGRLQIDLASLYAGSLRVGYADVGGRLSCNGDVYSYAGCTAREYAIYGDLKVDRGDLTIDGDALALLTMYVDGTVDVAGCLASGTGCLLANGDIRCGGGISAGLYVYTPGVIDCAGTIHSGTLATAYQPKEFGTVECSELVNGDIQMGTLVLIEDEDEAQEDAADTGE